MEVDKEFKKIHKEIYGKISNKSNGFVKILIILIIIAIFVAIDIIIVMLLWNWLAPVIGLNTINVLQTIGIMVLAKALSFQIGVKK